MTGRGAADHGPDHPLTAFFRLMGHRTWSRFGSLWIDAGRFSLVTIPCNVVVEAPRADPACLLRDTGRLVAVAVSPAETGVPGSDFWMRDRGHSQASLQRQFRQQVIRHGPDCDVRVVPRDELGRCGLGVNRDTMERRGLKMHRCTSVTGWAEVCAVAQAGPMPDRRSRTGESMAPPARTTPSVATSVPPGR